MSSSEDIPIIFGRIAKEGQEIRLVNVYKGFPISYPGTVTAVDRKSVQIKTNPFQIVCIYQDKETFIRASAFPTTVKGSVMRIHIPTTEVILSRFEYASKGIGARRQVRVEPADMVKGTIKNNDRKMNLTGELADISLDGMAVLLSPGMQAPKILREGTRVSVHIQLPIDVTPPQHTPLDIVPASAPKPERFSGIKKPLSAMDSNTLDTYINYPPIYAQDDEGLIQKEFTFEGVVVNVVADRELRKHRIGIRLLNNGPTRSAVSQFILQRQTTILNEIRDLYTVLAQATKNLAAGWQGE